MEFFFGQINLDGIITMSSAIVNNGGINCAAG
jgi:hypothetical protein